MKPGLCATQLGARLFAMRGAWRRLTRVAAACGLVTTLVLQPIQVAAYNDLDFQCSWENPSGYLYVYYKWGSINTAGGWANDFRLGTSAWSDAGSKLRLSYSSSAVSDVSTY